LKLFSANICNNFSFLTDAGYTLPAKFLSPALMAKPRLALGKIGGDNSGATARYVNLERNLGLDLESYGCNVEMYYRIGISQE